MASYHCPCSSPRGRSLLPLLPLFCCVVGAVLLCFPGSSRAQEPVQEPQQAQQIQQIQQIQGLRETQQPSATARLDALLAGIDTLSADVEQLIVEQDGGVLETSQIKMHLKRPGGFYWETIEPFPELIVTDGETLWNYQPDLEQVVIEDWNDASEELAARLLSGKTASINEEYTISLVDVANSNIGNVSASDEVAEFLLTPRAADSPYSGISLNFINGELDLIYLRDKNGQRTVWRFSGVARNLRLPPDLFTFYPPAGIEVVRNTYAP